MPELVARSLARALSSELRCEFFGRVTSGECRTGSPAQDRTPTVLIAACVGDGEEAEIVKLALGHPLSAIIALADDPIDQATTGRVLGELGVQACLPLNAPAEDIAAAIPCIYAGGRMLWPPIGHRLQASRPREPEALTKREWEVFDLLVREGMSDREIGAALHITTHTVHTHVNRILKKRNAFSRRQLREQLRLSAASASERDNDWLLLEYRRLAWPARS